MKMKRVRQAPKYIVEMSWSIVAISCDILAIQNISWPFDLWERMLMLWWADRKIGCTKLCFFLTSVILYLQFSVTCIKQRRRIYIVNPSIEIRLLNWKRPVYLPHPILGFKPNLFYVTLELMDKGNVVLKQLIATEFKILSFIEVL